MTIREQVLQTALTLPPEDRLYIVSALEDSVIPEEQASVEETDTAGVDVDPMFAEELRRRSVAYKTGQAIAKSADEVLAKYRNG